LGSRRIVVPDATQAPKSLTTSSVDEGLDCLGRELKALTGRAAVRVWLSGGLCRPFIVPAVTGVSTFAERQKIAESLAQVESGLAQPRVWLEERGASSGSVATCVSTDVLQRLNHVLKTSSKSLRVRRIAPWWAEVLRHSIRHRRTAQAVVVRDCDAVTVFAGAPHDFSAATSLTPVLEQESADDASARVLLPLGVRGSDVARWSLAMSPVGNEAWRSEVALGALAEERA
jgi:hypothetical protein